MHNSKLALLILIVLGFTLSSTVAQLSLTGAGSVAGGSGPPPTCDGTIDFSTGCAQAIPGGI